MNGEIATQKYSWNAEQSGGLERCIIHWEENLQRAKKGETMMTSATSCALCQLYKYKDDNQCNKCPLKIMGEYCCDDNSAYEKVMKVKNSNQSEIIAATENMLKVLQDTLAAGIKREVKKDD